MAPTLSLYSSGAEGYNPTAVLNSDILLSEVAPAPLPSDFSCTIGGDPATSVSPTIISGGSALDIIVSNLDEYTGNVLLSFTNASGNCRSAIDGTPATPFADLPIGSIA